MPARPVPAARSILWTPKWLVGHALVLAVVVSFSQFGFWQLRRHVERAETNAVAVERWATDPVDLDAALSAAATEAAAAGGDWAAALRDRRVAVTGVFEPADEVLRRPVSRDGRPGYHVVTPLNIEGDEAGRRLWVERGWVPEGWDEVPVEQAPPPPGRVRVTGWLRAPTTPPTGWVASIAPRDPPTGRLDVVAYLDPARLADQVAGPLVPAVLWLETTSPASAAAWPLAPVPPAAGSGPHLGYAIQWFAFTLITLIGYTALLRRVVLDT
jgi:surfeit locus 1 family protein